MLINCRPGMFGRAPMHGTYVQMHFDLETFIHGVLLDAILAKP